MKEREAWLRLAEEWDKPRASDMCAYGNDEQPKLVMVVMSGNVGLCVCLAELELHGCITPETRDAMDRKIPVERLVGFVWPTDRDGAAQRAAFCREQAAKCE